MNASAANVIADLDELIGRIQPEAKLPLAVILSARVTQLTAEYVNLPTETDQNLSVEEAAKRLGVSERYLYDHSGTLPFAVKVGSRLLFSSQGMDAWLRSRRGRR